MRAIIEASLIVIGAILSIIGFIQLITSFNTQIYTYTFLPTSNLKLTYVICFCIGLMLIYIGILITRFSYILPSEKALLHLNKKVKNVQANNKRNITINAGPDQKIKKNGYNSFEQYIVAVMIKSCAKKNTPCAEVPDKSTEQIEQDTPSFESEELETQAIEIFEK